MSLKKPAKLPETAILAGALLVVGPILQSAWDFFYAKIQHSWEDWGITGLLIMGGLLILIWRKRWARSIAFCVLVFITLLNIAYKLAYGTITHAGLASVILCNALVTSLLYWERLPKLPKRGPRRHPLDRGVSFPREGRHGRILAISEEGLVIRWEGAGTAIRPDRTITVRLLPDLHVRCRWSGTDPEGFDHFRFEEADLPGRYPEIVRQLRRAA